MLNRTTLLIRCVSIVTVLSLALVMAQELKPLPISPQANPIDPNSLNAPPAFGDSAPARKLPPRTHQDDLVPNELPSEQPVAAVEAEWQPKFRVVLMTTVSTDDKVVAAGQMAKPGLFEKDDARTRTTIRPAGNKSKTETEASAILLCDDVAVSATTSESGQLVYAFSCKGKVRLEIDDYIVQGDSMASKDGQLNITNAVITSRIAKLSAENLQISLPVISVRVESGNTKAEDQLPTPKPIPIPDPITDDNVFPDSLPSS